jgi:hypothetical protein
MCRKSCLDVHNLRPYNTNVALICVSLLHVKIDAPLLSTPAVWHMMKKVKLYFVLIDVDSGRITVVSGPLADWILMSLADVVL